MLTLQGNDFVDILHGHTTILMLRICQLFSCFIFNQDMIVSTYYLYFGVHYAVTLLIMPALHNYSSLL